MAQLSTDLTVLAKAAANFERIAGELRGEVARVQSTATGLDQQWKGTAAEAAQQAMRRFDAAATAHVAQLNDISNNIATAGVRYSATDEEQARRLASKMGIDGDKEHNGAQLVDWKQGRTSRCRLRLQVCRLRAYDLLSRGT